LRAGQDQNREISERIRSTAPLPMATETRSTSRLRTAMTSTEEDPESVVQILSSQPAQEDLVKVLSEFQGTSFKPTSASASIVFAIVSITIPEVWRSLRSNTESQNIVHLVVNSLASVAGVNALLMRLDQLHAAKGSSSSIHTSQMEDLLDVLTAVLEGDKFSPSSVIGEYAQSGTNGKMLFNEYLALVGGSKILNIVSRITMDFKGSQDVWIADGKLYSKWLGDRLGKAIKKYPDVPDVATLLGKALSIGYPCVFLD
jgi:hypothetical protein